MLKTEIIVDDSLSFTLKVYGCFLPDHHPVHVKYRRSVRNISICQLISELNYYVVCCGVEADSTQCKLFHHVISKICDSDDSETEQVPHEGYWRDKGCMLYSQESVCDRCNDYAVHNGAAQKVKHRRLSQPGHVKAPLSKTDPVRLKLTLQEQTLRCFELERELCEMCSELQKSSINVDHELSNDFT